MQTLRHQIALLNNGVLLFSFNQTKTVDGNAQMRSETFVELVGLRQQTRVQIEVQQEKPEILRAAADMKEVCGSKLLFGFHAQLREEVFRHARRNAQRQIASEAVFDAFKRQRIHGEPRKGLRRQIHARGKFNEAPLAVNQKHRTGLGRRVLKRAAKPSHISSTECCCETKLVIS